MGMYLTSSLFFVSKFLKMNIYFNMLCEHEYLFMVRILFLAFLFQKWNSDSPLNKLLEFFSATHKSAESFK